MSDLKAHYGVIRGIIWMVVVQTHFMLANSKLLNCSSRSSSFSNLQFDVYEDEQDFRIYVTIRKA